MVWQDDKSKVWIPYNDPLYLQSRHNITGCDKVISGICNALAGITWAALEQ